MSTAEPANDHLLDQAAKRGITEEELLNQLNRFRTGFPVIRLEKAATDEKGIFRIPRDQENTLLRRFEQSCLDGQIMKFVPASGAASRMFRSMLNTFHRYDRTDQELLQRQVQDPDITETNFFLDHLESFAFFPDLQKKLKKNGIKLSESRKSRNFKQILGLVLEEDGLGLSKLPKALIPFHTYSDHVRTPVEEHLVEAMACTSGRDGTSRVHFTLSPEHQQLFEHHLSGIRSRYEKKGGHITVETSFQHSKTDTVAVDENNRPFLDKDGNPVFRPGGHGALLENLDALDADIVFIKNIDNVAPDRLKESIHHYKKLTAGYLLQIRDQMATCLETLNRNQISKKDLEEVAGFIQTTFSITFPPKIRLRISELLSSPAFPENLDKKHPVIQFLQDRINRPLRVCGMVRNEGEPGGGPFFVRHSDQSISLQIVEGSQVDESDPIQKEIFQSSTHFNPVDLVCSLRDHRGHPFELHKYSDPETGFISTKSHDGRPLKALELPGLWNGGMAHWNTIFIEVPVDTFNPVKTVNDLLRPGHRQILKR